MKSKSILILLLSISLGCTDPVKREVYLIPNNFIGNIVVVYNYPKGGKEDIVGDQIIYKIPKDGVLFSQGGQHVLEFKYMKYFYVENGKWNRINDPEVYANKLCTGVVYSHHIESFQKNLQSKVYQFSVIGIGTKDSIPPEFDPKVVDFEQGKIIR